MVVFLPHRIEVVILMVSFVVGDESEGVMMPWSVRKGGRVANPARPLPRRFVLNASSDELAALSALQDSLSIHHPV